MTIKFRNYNSEADFKLIGDFLSKHYVVDNKDGNWLKSSWEFIHNHPCIKWFHVDKIGIWEDNGEIVGVVRLESPFYGYVGFDIHPQYGFLKKQMLAYAEKVFCGVNKDGSSYLNIFIPEFDTEFENVIKKEGYKKDENNTVIKMRYLIEYPFPEIKIPSGFKIQSLEDDYNFEKISRVIWRGFEYSGEPPMQEIDDLAKMHAWTKFRRNTTIAIESPDKSLVSICGMWYDDINKVTFVEPVATDPDFRNMGLGKAAVLEAIKRCGELGATVAFVEPDMEAIGFYEVVGFKKAYTSYYWKKS